MKLSLKSGIDTLLFGMKEKDVVAVMGEPNRRFKDDEKNTIYQYNDAKLRLTFYADEDMRLGYIIGASANLELGGSAIIGQKWETLEPKLQAAGLKEFEKETFDTTDNYFNETNWVIFQVEFGEVIRVELGAIINNKDEFDWKFK